MVLFAKDIMDMYKPVILLNLPHVKFIGGPTNQLITGNTQGAWNP